jgi:hypothetical protein
MKLLLKEIRKRLLSPLAAASMILCLVMFALWVRSYMVVDEFQLNLPAHSEHTLESNAGILQLTLRWWPKDSRPVLFGVFHGILPRLPTGGWGPQFAFVPGNPYGYYASWKRVRVPFWAVFLASGVLPMSWLVRAVARSAMHRPGYCAQCGYDLRATPERCPECGTPAVASIEQS